jgi:hypothetical protein
LHGRSLHDSAGIKRTPSNGQWEVDRERAAGLTLGLSPQVEYLGNLWRAFVDQQFASIQTVHDGLVSVGAKDLINFPELVDHFPSSLVSIGAVGGPARQADRHPHDVLDATMDTAVGSSPERRAAHLPALPRAAAAMRIYLSSVIVVVRFTMSMLGTCDG